MQLKPVTDKIQAVAAIAVTGAGKIYGTVRHLPLVVKVENWAKEIFHQLCVKATEAYNQTTALRLKTFSWISCKVKGTCENSTIVKTGKVVVDSALGKTR